MNKREKDRLRRNLKTKYQALFLNKYDFEGLDYGVKKYFMSKLLHTGNISAFKLKTNKDINLLGFGSFTPNKYNWNGQPITARPMNEYGSTFIPNNFLIVDEEIVLLSLDIIPQTFINEFVERIIDIEGAIKTNLDINKVPWILKSTDQKTINAIKKILGNDSFVVVDELTLEVLPTNPHYIIDKLQLYKSETEAELLTILGIDNVKFEKKAQMVMDEVNSNDDEIRAYEKIMRSKLDAFFNQIKEVLGFEISIKEQEQELVEYDEGVDEYEND